MIDLSGLIEAQEEGNRVMQELLKNVKRSNKILMMVNAVNIATIITIMIMILVINLMKMVSLIEGG